MIEKTHFKRHYILYILFLFLGLSACAPHQIYRTDLSLCTHSKPETECNAHALQEFINPNKPEEAYTLGFIEFDDQGQLHQRAQMKSVIENLTTQTATGDTLIVVFAHGWQHSAAPGDPISKLFARASNVSVLLNPLSVVATLMFRPAMSLAYTSVGEALPLLRP